MPVKAIQDRLRAAFPVEADAAVIRSVRQGVHLADDLIVSAPILNTLVGKDYRGLIRRAGVMHSIHEAAIRGDLPFTTEIRRMRRGHWHLLEIASGHERAQICRTEEALAFPDDTPVKQDERLANTYDLFEPLPPIDIMLAAIPRLYVWLAFGVDHGGALTHVCWGVPAKREKDWLAHVNILRGAAGAMLVPPPAAPDPKSKLRFKEHIEAAIDDTKKNDKSSA